MRPTPRRPLLAAAAAAVTLTVAAGVSAAEPSAPPQVVSVRQAASQSAPALPGSEADTLVEPDIAVSPVDPKIALAVSHSGRYEDGGAVGIETAWTRDGGRTWVHRTLPGITRATGGPTRWTRASDPVAAYGPDGTAYVSTLVINLETCNSGVLLSRSDDGGKTFGKPVITRASATCSYSIDKNWLAVDTGATSPRRGRVYQFWTAFTNDPEVPAPQMISWSTDKGRTWSTPRRLSGASDFTQNSQPMILADGTIVDVYSDSGAITGDASDRYVDRSQWPPRVRVEKGGRLTASISRDGGGTWRKAGTVTRAVGGDRPGFRCCLSSSAVDPVTGRMFTVWNALQRDAVVLSTSTDGRTWSAPRVVNRPDGRWTINADVAARGGTVLVSYALADPPAAPGAFGRHQLSFSTDSGRSFGASVAVGPRIDYRYAAISRGYFPGDYIGTALGDGLGYAIIPVSTKPADPGADYHQVLFAATVSTR